MKRVLIAGLVFLAGCGGSVPVDDFSNTNPTSTNSTQTYTKPFASGTYTGNIASSGYALYAGTTISLTPLQGTHYVTINEYGYPEGLYEGYYSSLDVGLSDSIELLVTDIEMTQNAVTISMDARYTYQTIPYNGYATTILKRNGSAMDYTFQIIIFTPDSFGGVNLEYKGLLTK
jgi:hypothetical protein